MYLYLTKECSNVIKKYNYFCFNVGLLDVQFFCRFVPFNILPFVVGSHSMLGRIRRWVVFDAGSYSTLGRIWFLVIFDTGSYSMLSRIQCRVIFDIRSYSTLDHIRNWVKFDVGSYSKLGRIQSWVVFKVGSYSTFNLSRFSPATFSRSTLQSFDRLFDVQSFEVRLVNPSPPTPMVLSSPWPEP